MLYSIIKNSTSSHKVICIKNNTHKVRALYSPPPIMVFKLIKLILCGKVAGVVIHDRIFIPLSIITFLLGVRCFFICHNMFSDFLFLTRWLPLQKIICVSNSVRKHVLESGIKDSKVVVIENGFYPPSYCSNEREFRHLLEKRNQRVLSGNYHIAFVGRTKKEKGIYDLIDAYRGIVGEISPTSSISLSIIGQVDSELTEYISQSSFREKIKIVGLLDSPFEKLHAMEIDGVVIPSHHEGFGLVLAEAVAAGVDVYASKIPPFIELSEDLPVVFFEPRNPVSIKDALLRKRPNDVDINHRFICSQRMIGRYSFKSMHEKYNDFFLEEYRA